MGGDGNRTYSGFVDYGRNISVDETGKALDVVLTETKQPVKRIRVRWQGDFSDIKRVLGDSPGVERGDLAWLPVMPEKISLGDYAGNGIPLGISTRADLILLHIIEGNRLLLTQAVLITTEKACVIIWHLFQVIMRSIQKKACLCLIGKFRKI